ncbi:2-dehydropantoate 2-reductase [Nonomuraea sp. NPDC050556]|uniref:2-dehydropantoate 2-reductase n=1 Tax=Nonomuraea sp. NPDC050556 TaxID=3364369 RepID=UPI0037BD0B10
MARVALVGPGAIGSVCAAAVEQTGRHELTLYGRRDPGPLSVEDERTGKVHPITAPLLTEAREGHADWVLLAVKAHQTEGAADHLRALCGPRTTVVVLQNGVEHRERVAPFTGAARIVPAIAWIEAETVAPGRTLLRAKSRVKVPAGEEFADLMRGGLVTVEDADDFVTEVWRKLTSNAVAGLMALAGRRASIYHGDDLQALARDLAAECLTVARAEGARLPDGVADEIVAMYLAMPQDSGSSILFDRLAGRPLEWDARNGVVRRRGRALGVPTPISDVLVPLLAAASG